MLGGPHSSEYGVRDQPVMEASPRYVKRRFRQSWAARLNITAQYFSILDVPQLRIDNASASNLRELGPFVHFLSNCRDISHLVS
jgi:hypothetical protein